MSRTPEELIVLADQYENTIAETLVKDAKDKPKLNPKAKVRNKPSPAFPAESSVVSNHTDHYPLSSANQARNAWARAHQTGGKAPSWYKGTYSSFLAALKRKIHSKFPGIELSDGKKKKSSAMEVSETLLTKYGK
jgi:hypothetical protein